MKILTLFIFNFFINNIFIFLTSFLLIEVLFLVLRIKNYRLRYFSRIIIIIKMIFDVFHYQFSNWVYLKNINPILSEKGSRMLTAFFGYSSKFPFYNSSISFFMNNNNPKSINQNNYTFSISDIFSFQIGFSITLCITLFLILGTFLAITIKLLKFIKRRKDIKKILRNLTPLSISINNFKLKKELYEKKIKIYSSKMTSSPCIVKQKFIYLILPKNIFNLFNINEIEAIIAHEIFHKKWFDYYTFPTLEFITAIFWYIPLMKYFIKKISIEKEYACDQSYKYFNLDHLELANAIKKCSKLSPNNNLNLSSSFFRKKELLYKRIKILIKSNNLKKWPQIITGILLFNFLLMIIFSKLWIF